MKRIQLKTFGVATLAILLLVVAASFQTAPAQARGAGQDTVPQKKVRNVEDALEELERGRMEMEASLRDIDLSKIEKEISESMKQMKIDLEKMQVDLEKSMKELDAAKIDVQLDKAMKELDAARMTELQALKEVDWEKMKTEIKSSLSKIDGEKIRADIEKAQKIEMKQLQEELKKIRPTIEKSLQEARVSMENAKKELTGYKNFIDELHGAGLIDKNKDYSIVYKDGSLTINGKKQPADVVSKYNFLKEKKDFNITKSADDFDIDR